MQTILVVEDEIRFVDLLKCWLETPEGVFDVLHAEDLDTGSKLFNENSNKINLVVVDACVPGSHPNSMLLIKEIIRSGFKGPVVATSSNPDFNNILIEAGATHKVAKGKTGPFVLELLGSK